jgi:hypothetical protein
MEGMEISIVVSGNNIAADHPRNILGRIKQGHALRDLYYTVTKHILILEVNVSMGCRSDAICKKRLYAWFGLLHYVSL